MTIDTQGLRQLAKVLCIRTAVNGEMIEIQEAADQIDRLHAELEESSLALTLAGKTNKGLMDQLFRDSKELRRLCADRDKWRAQAKHETLAGKAAAEEVERLREALRGCVKIIERERRELVDCATDPKTGGVAPNDHLTQQALREYDDVLAPVRAALQGGSNANS